jgi:DNA repair protein RadA/Sms
MVKAKSIYICQSCSFESAKWVGQCPNCNEWNTFAETVVEVSRRSVGGSSKKSQIINKNAFYLNKVKAKDLKRVKTGVSEFDRVIGNGFVNGQVILLAGEPGIGKSTLLTQIAQYMSKIKKDVVYVCGEESPGQIKLRADRLKYSPDNLLVLAENDSDIIAATVENLVSAADEGTVGLIIVDSIQSLSSENLTGIAGSVGQVRYGAQELSQMAKRLGVPLVLVGHVTKEGTVAGPKVLEHLVDTVLYLEGDTQHMFRILKTTKNRFGAVSEVGIFEMGDLGLVEVLNPSEMLLGSKDENVAGSCVTVVMEGYRPLLFEIQALTVKTAFGYPRRTTSGFNVNRLQLLIAILEKRAKLNLSNHDVYVNVAGGFKVSEYAVDLAVCLAIASSLKDKPLKPNVAAFGECGLLGEVRQVSHQDRRANEAKKLGYTRVVSPQNARFLSDAIRRAF